MMGSAIFSVIATFMEEGKAVNKLAEHWYTMAADDYGTHVVGNLKR